MFKFGQGRQFIIEFKAVVPGFQQVKNGLLCFSSLLQEKKNSITTTNITFSLRFISF